MTTEEREAERAAVERDRHLALLAAIICAGRQANGEVCASVEAEAHECVRLASAI